MKRILVGLTGSQDHRLREAAARRHTSVAALVREAVDRTFPDDAERRRAAHLRSLAAIGRFRDTATDVSEHHDDYLAEAYATKLERK
jgi:hypothetical protein